MNKTKIIVVEDNIVYCEYVCNMLSREGYRNMKAYHLSTAKKHLQQATDNDIVVADLRLPDGSGIDLLCWMRKEGKMQPFIIMTDYAEVNTAVESMKLGSIDYIPKQLVEDKLVPLIRSILKERQAGQRRMPIFAREGSAFQKIMHRIRLVAATDMSVMIFGENGTGKEHIAHLLHDKSKRAGKPFVAVDCGSLSKELAPSAFFGHVKGAFTGADNAKKGYFHEAEGGTLFLDEVGNLALETQQMLLRAIQERRYRPVGDKADRNFNVRIIAATNEDLEVSVNEKRFRQDLLYRLHDFGITVPPLRDCQEDIMPLAEFFRDMANRELECSVSGFSSEARKALLTHAWPGNVRELRQKVMGAVLQAQEGVVMKEHLELAVTKPTSTVSFALREYTDTFSVGWHFNQRFEGKGLAYEAATGLLDYLFHDSGARRIYGFVEDDNLRSKRLCERLGMRHEGCMKEFISFVCHPDGAPRYEDTCIYAILNKEWKSNRQR